MWNMFGFAKPAMVDPEEALPGRLQRTFAVSSNHLVLGSSMTGPWPEGTEVIYLAMGCFWGAERRLWQVPGVIATSVGYMGGYTPNPSYEEVCSGRTGHTETVMVAYDGKQSTLLDILRVFWECHDPTQGYRQGNDVGTQYRSAVYWTTPEQQQLVEATAAAYAGVLAEKGFDPITTEMAPAEGRNYYIAEDYHQQYLAKNPHGYDCHANTGVALPAVAV